MRWKRFISLAGSLVVTAVVAFGCGAHGVSVNQTYRIGADGNFTVKGHGFGHGHGMGQYGAEGAARAGLTYKQILAFYYPGTTLDSVSGNIRVLISADTTDDVVVLPQAGLKVRDLGKNASFALSKSGVKRWRLTTASGRTIVQYKTDRWRRYLRATFTGDGEFTAEAGRLSLVTPAGTRVYRGALRAASPSSGSSARDTVNVVSVEHYLRGVVPAEMPASWSTPALRAQSVAARTYALWSRQSRINRHWQICDTTACQVYRGYGAEVTSTNNAIDATAGEYLTYKGAPAFTQFSASTGGWNAAGSAPYLVAQEDPYDDWAGNKVHTWSVDVKAAVAQKKYPAIGTLTSIKVTSRDGNGDWQGRVLQMTLVGSKGSKTLSGAEFRSLYGLRSSWFTVV